MLHAEGTESLYPANRKVCNAFSSVVCGGRGGLASISRCVLSFNTVKKKNSQGDAIMSIAQHGNPTNGEVLLSSVSCERL